MEVMWQPLSEPWGYSLSMTCTGPSSEGELRDLPQSSRCAYVALKKANRPLTTAELAEEIDFSTRTVRKSVERLRERGLVEWQYNVTNPHAHRHTLTSSPSQHMVKSE